MGLSTGTGHWQCDGGGSPEASCLTAKIASVTANRDGGVLAFVFAEGSSLNKCMGGWVTGEFTCGLVGRWMDGLKNRWMSGWMEMDELMGGWLGRVD